MLWGGVRLFEHSFAVMRVFLVISMVCFIPRLFITDKGEASSLYVPLVSQGTFTLGLENIKKEFIMQLCPGKELVRIGLITNNYATDQYGTNNVELLTKKDFLITKVFHPKYVFSGQDTVQSSKYTDNIEFYPVYNEGFHEYMLDGLDLLLIDLPDVGIGYGYAIALLFDAIHKGMADGLPIVVLDRPNILGQKIEGSLCYPLHQHIPIKLPIRHGMTIGELAQFYNMQVLNGMAHMHIIPMHDYHRIQIAQTYAQHPTNVAHSNAIYGFSICGALSYVAPFDVGLSTLYPYSCIALPASIDFPEHRWYQLQVILRRLGINSSFCGHFSDSKKEHCHGLRIQIMNIDQVDIFRTLLVILEFFKCSGVVLAFSDYFDQAVGTSLIRHYIQGKISKKELTDFINKDLESFYRSAFGSFMYYPLPQVSLI